MWLEGSRIVRLVTALSIWVTLPNGDQLSVGTTTVECDLFSQPVATEAVGEWIAKQLPMDWSVSQSLGPLGSITLTGVTAVLRA